MARYLPGEALKVVPYTDETAFATRVIDVGRANGSRQPWLRISKRESGELVALSHCWGKKPRFVTDSSNILARKCSMPLKTCLRLSMMLLLLHGNWGTDIFGLIHFTSLKTITRTGWPSQHARGTTINMRLSLLALIPPQEIMSDF